jgi:hypothetical protein
MDFKKIYKRGLGFTVLLLIVIIGVLFIPNLNKNPVSDGNSIFTSAPEDNYEPNNNAGSAYDIISNEGNWLSSLNGTGTQWDDDWYMINIMPGKEQLSVMLTFNHSEGDIDIELYDSGVILLTGSYNTMDNENIDYIVPSPGIYYLKIYYGNMGNVYDLWWNSTLPTDDAYEQNDFDWEAYDLSPWPDMWLPFGLGIQSDDDWYTVYLDPGEEKIHVELSFSHAAGNIDIEIWYWNGTFTYLTGRYSLDDNEYLDEFVPWPGTYYIKVFGDNNGNSYDLWWEDLSIAGEDDLMEENDDFWSSAEVHPDIHYGLKLIYSDEDWFHIFLNPGDTIEVNIYFNNMEGNLELELYDPSNFHRAESKTMNDGEHISFTLDSGDESGNWRIHVYHASADSEVHYGLQIYVNFEYSGDDHMEDNDGFWGSWPVDPNRYPNLKLVEDDEDWFHIFLNPGEIIEVNIYFENEDGDLELELYDPFEDPRMGSYSSDDRESIVYKVDTAGEWRIRVYHKIGDTEVPYELDIWLLEDFYEWNDDIHVFHDRKDHRSNLIQLERTWLSDIYGKAVQGSPDWYIIEVSPGFEHLRVELTFNHTLGNIDMNIYYIHFDEYNNYMYHSLMDGSYSSTDNETLDFFTSSGYYFVEVYGDSWRNEYDMWWDDLKTDMRSDDNYEINNAPLSAYNISHIPGLHLWGYNGLGLQFDEDWYEIKVVNSNMELTVWIGYDSAEGLMGFELYNKDLVKLASNFTLEDNGHIIRDVYKGTYFIRVFGDNTGNVYNLGWNTKEHEEMGTIPGYDLLILVASVIGISMVGIKIKRSKLKHK